MKLCLACSQAFEGDTWDCPKCGFSPAVSNEHLTFSPEIAEKNNSFSADFFPQLAQLEANNFWFRSRNRLITWALATYLPDAKSFLEIGCGTGYVLSGIRQEFPKLKLSASEIFSKGLSFAGERIPESVLYQMDARHIPFEEEFDAIGAFDVLEHIDEDDDVLFQMFRAVKRGGGILLTVPQHRFLWSEVDEYSFHKRRYERAEILQKVYRAGFEPIRVTSFVALLLPFMMVSRIKNRNAKHSGNFDPLSEFKINKSLSAILERILDFERLLIRLRVSFPLGGSLLLIAKRR